MLIMQSKLLDSPVILTCCWEVLDCMVVEDIIMRS